MAVKHKFHIAHDVVVLFTVGRRNLAPFFPIPEFELLIVAVAGIYCGFMEETSSWGWAAEAALPHSRV